jgi:hypothetical protein
MKVTKKFSTKLSSRIYKSGEQLKMVSARKRNFNVVAKINFKFIYNY